MDNNGLRLIGLLVLLHTSVFNICAASAERRETEEIREEYNSLVRILSNPDISSITPEQIQNIKEQRARVLSFVRDNFAKGKSPAVEVEAKKLEQTMQLLRKAGVDTSEITAISDKSREIAVQAQQGLAVMLSNFGAMEKSFGICNCCSQKPEKLFICNSCKSVGYCGKECQESVWEERHKLECKFLRKHQAFLNTYDAGLAGVPAGAGGGAGEKLE